MPAYRILHCPNIVGGNAQGLASAERQVGLKSWAVSLKQNRFAFEIDEVLSNNMGITELRRWSLLRRALNDFDVIHFNFGQSLAPQWIPKIPTKIPLFPVARALYNGYAKYFELRDLPLLKKAGKGIVVTYQGDDARQGNFCKENFVFSPVDAVEPGYYTLEWDEHKRRRIEEFSKYADRIYALNPDLLQILPQKAQFLPYAHVDWREWQVADSKRPSRIPLVIHAPTHRGVKGTQIILDVISRLKAEGVPFDFRLIEGLPYSEAKRIYREADLLIDQLLVGWYGGLAVELMALGKPVICYIREGDLKFIPDEMCQDLPIINATPADLYDVLKKYLTTHKLELANVGRRSREYVEKWHDPLMIARKLKREYDLIMTSKVT